MMEVVIKFSPSKKDEVQLVEVEKLANHETNWLKLHFVAKAMSDVPLHVPAAISVYW